jgi:hypothetical protein
LGVGFVEEWGRQHESERCRNSPFRFQAPISLRSGDERSLAKPVSALRDADHFIGIKCAL